MILRNSSVICIGARVWESIRTEVDLVVSDGRIAVEKRIGDLHRGRSRFENARSDPQAGGHVQFVAKGDASVNQKRYRSAPRPAGGDQVQQFGAGVFGNTFPSRWLLT